MGKYLDLTGKVFGRLTVIREAEKRGRERYWLCRCSCGTIKEVHRSNLLYEHTQSCGCLAKEVSREVNRKHWDKGGYMYSLWVGIKQRCYNKKALGYRQYGARGISMDSQWREEYISFSTWVREELGERPTDKHSLDRIDNEGDYVPGNLRWATKRQQAENRRTANVVVIGGEAQSVKEWCRRLGITSGNAYYRRKVGGQEGLENWLTEKYGLFNEATDKR